MDGQHPDIAPLCALSDAERARALERYGVLQPCVEHAVPLTHVARQHHLPLRTVQRWLAQYRHAGFAGLARRGRSDRGHQRRLRPELKQVIEGFALRTPPPTVAFVHRQACAVARQHGWPVPTYPSVYRVVKHLDPGLLTLAHEGTKAYRTTFDLLYRRASGTSNDIWQADHTLLDLWVQQDGGAPARPWLTVIMDDYSRAIAGFGVSFHAPSAIQTALVLRQAIWRKSLPQWHICGIPTTFYMEYVPRNIFHVMWPFVLCGLTARWSVISWWCSSVWPHNAYRDWSHWRSDGSSRQMGFPRHASAVSVDTSHAWSASAFIRSVISA